MGKQHVGIQTNISLSLELQTVDKYLLPTLYFKNVHFDEWIRKCPCPTKLSNSEKYLSQNCDDGSNILYDKLGTYLIVHIEAMVGDNEALEAGHVGIWTFPCQKE